MLSPDGVEDRRALRALTAHNVLSVREGILSILTVFLC